MRVKDSLILPNAIIIGAQKAGTTSVYNWLIQHPEIYGDMIFKDFNFFVKDEYFKEKGLVWLSRQFEKDYKGEKIILHGCVNYIFFKEKFVENVLKALPNVKLIVLLRNPVERAYSAYWYQIKVGMETVKTFEEAIRLEKERLKSNNMDVLSELTYISHGFYYEQLSYLLKYFKKDQLKVVLFDDLKNKPDEIVKELFSFLGVRNDFIPNFVKINEAGIPRFPIVSRILQRIKLPKYIKDLIPVKSRARLKWYILHELNVKKTKYPPIKPETRKYLIELYEDDIKNLQRLINRDLSAWLK